MKIWILSWVLNWLAERTTWAGFALAASTFGMSLEPHQQSALIALAVSFFAMPDRKNLPKS